MLRHGCMVDNLHCQTVLQLHTHTYTTIYNYIVYLGAGFSRASLIDVRVEGGREAPRRRKYVCVHLSAHIFFMENPHIYLGSSLRSVVATVLCAWQIYT